MGHHERLDLCGPAPSCCASSYYAFASLLSRIETLETLMAVTQADIDALTNELVPAVQRIRDEVAALEAAQSAGSALDLSGLKAAVDNANAVVPESVQPTPAPEPAPAPEPVPAPEPAPVDPGTDPGAPVVDPTSGLGGTTDPTPASGDTPSA